jgi:predicted acyl esterase
MSLLFAETDDWKFLGVGERVKSRPARRAGGRSEDEGKPGWRTYMNLGGGLNRPRSSETDPPSFLRRTTPPLTHDLDLVGPIELQLDAACTAPDTASTAILQDEEGKAAYITACALRAGLPS